MSTLTNEAPAQDHELELLIREVQEQTRRRRRRHAVRAAVVLLAVVLIAAVLFVVMSTRPSGSVPVASRISPAQPATLESTGSPTLSALPPGVARLSGVACSSPSTCVVVGTGGVGTPDRNLAYLTRDGGVLWTRSAVPAVGIGVSDVSCSGETCVSSGGQQLHVARTHVVDRSTDGGATWTASIPPIGTKGQIDSTACATQTSCVLSTGVSLYWSSDAGATWHPATTPAHLGLGTVACMTATECIATGVKGVAVRGSRVDPRYVLRSTDAGRTWSVVDTLKPTPEFWDATCPTSTSCSLLEGAGFTNRVRMLTTADAGKTWSDRLMPASITMGRQGGLDCVSAIDCFAWSNRTVGNSQTEMTTMVRTDDGGSSWTRDANAHPAVVITSAACVAESLCELIGADSVGIIVMGSSNAGRSWAYEALPPGVLQITSTACTSLNACVVATRANRGGSAYVTLDGGLGWAEATLANRTAPLTDVSCPIATFCAAASNGIATSIDGGATWTHTSYALGSGALNGVSCFSATSCVLVGGTSESLVLPGGALHPSSLALLWRNGRLRRVPVSGVASQLDAVSCTPGTCVAVGGQLDYGGSYPGPVTAAYSHDGGLTWTRATIPASVAGLRSVSCPTARVCVAVGQYEGQPGSEPEVIVSVDGGARWSTVPTLHRNGGYLGVACAAASRCVATGVWGEREKPFSVLVTETAPGGRYSALTPTAVIYTAVGKVSAGELFGVRATSPANDPRITRVP